MAAVLYLDNDCACCYGATGATAATATLGPLGALGPLGYLLRTVVSVVSKCVRYSMSCGWIQLFHNKMAVCSAPYVVHMVSLKHISWDL
jgi:hypothetical protein